MTSSQIQISLPCPPLPVAGTLGPSRAPVLWSQAQGPGRRERGPWGGSVRCRGGGRGEGPAQGGLPAETGRLRPSCPWQPAAGLPSPCRALRPRQAAGRPRVTAASRQQTRRAEAELRARDAQPPAQPPRAPRRVPVTAPSRRLPWRPLTAHSRPAVPCPTGTPPAGPFLASRGHRSQGGQSLLPSPSPPRPREAAGHHPAWSRDAGPAPRSRSPGPGPPGSCRPGPKLLAQRPPLG